MTTLPRVALYARTAQASSAIVIDHQLAELRAFCDERDWPVAAIYQDTGKTRVSLRKMLDHARQTPDSFEAIVVRDVARISRQQSEVVTFMKEINKLGIQLAIVHGPQA